jgi:hypothetical protein
LALTASDVPPFSAIVPPSWHLPFWDLPQSSVQIVSQNPGPEGGAPVGIGMVQ